MTIGFILILNHQSSYPVNMFRFRFILVLQSLAFSGFIIGQTGPGGVGSSANNVIWLRADADVFSDAGTTPAAHTVGVAQWNDQSGNSRNASQGSAGNRPLYFVNAQNGYPALRFTGNTFIDPPSLGLANNGSYTYFLTFRDTVTSLGGMNDGNGHFILDRTTATNALVSLKPATGSFYGFQKRNDAGGGLGGPLTTTSINTNVKTIEMRRAFNTNYQLFYNAQLQTTLAETDGNTTPPTPRIGRHATTANNGIRGFIHEFIVFNFALNTPQTIIVNNYLGAKYGYSLLSDDLYVQDEPANGNYDHEVAGIGRLNGANQVNDAQGSGIVRVLNPNNLGNNEYMFWGHDNGVLQATETTDVPSGVEARFERVWRVSEVNTSATSINVGSIEMRWDLSNLLPVTASDLRLLVDTDNDGIFSDETPISGASDIGGNIYAFTGITAITDNVRFTLGTINSNQTPLPVELLSINALPLEETVVLKWTTASEINNDFFTLERSSDIENWTELAIVPGAGNSENIQNYKMIDDHPLSGISYYRLKQTDFDGSQEYLGIRAVDMKNDQQNDFLIFPNPASDKLKIVTTEKLFSIDIFNMSGQKILSENNLNDLDISNIPNGLYLIRLRLSDSIEYSRIFSVQH